MPVLFIGHGSPMNMILRNSFTEHLIRLGQTLPRPEAIMVISAHYLTRGTQVTCMDRPPMIYDFSGFPHELYRVSYLCRGAPEIAESITRMGSVAGTIRCDHEWGLDHGAYSVLRHMYPRADIPVFEMSLDYRFGEYHPKPIEYHYDLAQKLRPLREKGVLIIGSGNCVHNLAISDFRDLDAEPFDWTKKEDAYIKSCLETGKYDDLVAYPTSGENASLAVPTLDHYLPMIYTLGLAEKGEKLQFTYEGIQNGSISMRSFCIG